MKPSLREIEELKLTLAKCSPSKLKRALVNFIRHHRIDDVEIEVKDNYKYLQVYIFTMKGISADYPFLSEEVERQIAKKIRWQARRENGIEGFVG